MKVKEINVEASYLRSLPNYENIRVTAGITVSLSDNEDYNEVYEEAWEIVSNQIIEQLNLLTSK